MSGEVRYTIEELAEKTGFPRRTIRYYVQEGLLDPPSGRGRGGFYYDSHLGRLLFIKGLQEKGLRLSAIAGRIKTVPGEPAAMKVSFMTTPSSSTDGEEWIHYRLSPYLEITVRRDYEYRAGQRIEKIIRIAKAVLEEKLDD